MLFFGLGVGSLVAHIAKNRLRKDILPVYLVKSSLGFAISIGLFLLVTSYIIPPSVDFLYLFYLTSSVPFFFAGIAIALIFYSRPRDISKLYFLYLFYLTSSVPFFFAGIAIALFSLLV